MRQLVFSVPAAYGGAPLKAFLRGPCGISSRLMTRLKREPMGIIRNGAHAIVTERLEAGDAVCLNLPDDKNTPEPVPLPFPVVFEDADLIVADKPAGMPMYPTPGHDRDSLANAAGAYFRRGGERTAFRPVYRLDRNTTGLVVLAKHAFAAARLAHAVQKTYFAVCEGKLSGSGTIDQPIARLEGHRVQRCVHPGGERAVTGWRALAAGDGYSLLSLELKTGRTHQIRVHLSSIGHPLAGDDMYGGARGPIARQALHCGEIRFVHPVTRRPMSFSRALPADMRELLHVCGFSEPIGGAGWVSNRL